MNRFLVSLAVMSMSLPMFAAVEESVLPSMETIYSQDFGGKVNKEQKELMQKAIQNKQQKLRIMTYNMLYNVQEAERKLLPKHQWATRKPRLLEYLSYANADIIGSQELQDDQVQELMSTLGNTYDYYGEKTRQNEGRTDTNAVFFKKSRIELIDAKTIPYKDEKCENAFTYCYFKDKLSGKKFVVLNTKFSWGSPDRRLAEATQLTEFSSLLPKEEAIIALGDFNIFPFMSHKQNIFFDGDYVLQVLSGKNLKDARNISAFGHFGPLCSITNARETIEPFIGPQLVGFVLDHIFVNDRVEVCTHGIDPARVDGNFPSDHLPVLADIALKST